MEKAKLQEIIKNNTDEKGDIDFEKVGEIVASENQKKIDSIIVGNKNKSKEKLSKMEEELNELKNSSKKAEPEIKADNLDDSDLIKKQFEELKSQIENMQKEKEKESKIKAFKKSAKELKVDDILIDSGSDLDKIDLDKFKGKEQIIKNLGEDDDSEEESGSGLSKVEQLLL
jgi:organic radical activating enzyme